MSSLLIVLLGSGVAGGVFLLAATPVWADAPVGAAVIALCAALTLVVSPGIRMRSAALWAVVALGAAMQLRLGAEPAAILLVLCSAAAVHALVAVGGPVVLRRGRPQRLQAVSLFLLAAALVARLSTAFFGDLQSGSIELPGGSVQVGEFTRVAVIVGSGLLLADLVLPARTKTLERSDMRSLLVGGVLLAVNVLALAIVDSGPAVLLLGALIVMAVVATRDDRFRVRSLRPGPGSGSRRVGALALAAVAVVAGGAALVWSTSIGERLSARWGDVLDPGYQLSTALHALQTGGFVGLGVGTSSSASAIPAARSDYLPAVVGADLGIGALIAAVSVLILVCGSLIVTSARATRPASVVGSGAAAALFGQVVMSAFGVIGVIPLSGVSMSFLTVTGAATTACFLQLGLIAATARVGAGRVVRVGAGRVARAQNRQGTKASEVPAVAVAVAAAFAASGILLAAIAPAPSAAAILSAQRGDIRTADGVVIATTGPGGAREYPRGSLYTGIAYLKPGYAAYGVEDVAGDQLTCGGDHEPVEIVLQVVRPLPCHPADVRLTMLDSVQTALAEALGGRRGSAVVLDSPTGDVLGSYSTDQLEPSDIPLDELPPSDARTGWGSPGSTFKMIVASAALLDGIDASGASTEVVEVDGQRVENSDGFVCPDTRIVTMLTVSCNTTAAALALRLGQQRLEDVARSYFGAERELRFDGGAVSPLTTGLADGDVNSASLARTGYGQESVQSSALSLAAATAVIAQGAGPHPEVAAPAPHLLPGSCSDGSVTPSPLGEPLPAAVAATVLEGMRGAVGQGTATALQTATTEWDIAAKTGTAQVPDSVSTTGLDSWVTMILDTRWVLTVQLHDVAPDAADNPAVDVAATVLDRFRSDGSLTPDGGTPCVRTLP
ncbi:penicillin-binding transpeptidase domain-containing protein [Cnuibacter physcomitrellae]|uniref:penicillin-binding transpeptidase domain-containing protein n=1 Tax=Cnuibacter physcomitrellae TaxID=1619308 RepID=UPI002175CFDA|nr:penicillin-binding transpeptidase domain-containing protein [Cnuibacter physcomitrellae]MCS5495708.1 penicillin-binding transpeptidase domain-containing protein [Cnuibacter physcomitrellae]